MATHRSGDVEVTAADLPVENSELREALDELQRVTSRTSPSLFAAARSRIEELFAESKQRYDDSRRISREVVALSKLTADTLKAEISRLRADRLACPICGADPAIGAHTSDCPNRDIALDIDSHLTPEEARHLGGLSVSIRKSAADGCGICQRINAKLSRISGSGSQ